MNGSRVLSSVFDPSRFLFDPGRYAASLDRTGSGWTLRISDRTGALSFRTTASREGATWRAEAHFETTSADVSRSLAEFARRERRYGGR